MARVVDAVVLCCILAQVDVAMLSEAVWDERVSACVMEARWYDSVFAPFANARKRSLTWVGLFVPIVFRSSWLHYLYARVWPPVLLCALPSLAWLAWVLTAVCTIARVEQSDPNYPGKWLANCSVRLVLSQVGQ